MPLCSSTESGKKVKKSIEKWQIYEFLQILQKSSFYICRAIKLPAIQKKLQQQTES